MQQVSVTFCRNADHLINITQEIVDGRLTTTQVAISKPSYDSSTGIHFSTDFSKSVAGRSSGTTLCYVEMLPDPEFGPEIGIHHRTEGDLDCLDFQATVAVDSASLDAIVQEFENGGELRLDFRLVEVDRSGSSCSYDLQKLYISVEHHYQRHDAINQENFPRRARDLALKPIYGMLAASDTHQTQAQAWIEGIDRKVAVLVGLTILNLGLVSFILWSTQSGA